MSFVALPLLPNRGFGPYGIVNPYELWLLTIAMAGVSFMAYAAIRMLGPSRGVVVASVAGALVSSTAVTLYLARLNRHVPNLRVYVGAALLAGAVMAVRLSVITVVLSPPLFERLLTPLGVFAAVSTVLGLAAAGRGGASVQAEIASPMKSPFELDLVLKFVLVLGVVMAATRVLSALYGASGLLPIAALGGLADADAVTLATARMTTEGLDLGLGAAAVLLAAAIDSISKTGVALIIGGGRFGLWFAAGALLSAAPAVGAMYFL